MKKYIALLRGVNIGGKNKIPMGELKVNCEKLGLEDVKTYLNSGNLTFLSDQDDKAIIIDRLEQMIKEVFGLHIPVFVILEDELKDILQHAPDWWGKGSKEIYDNLIFVLKPATFQDVFSEIGPPKKGLEQIENYKDAVFWSFNRNNYQKTNWWSKTANASISNKLTIRTAGTILKICKV